MKYSVYRQQPKWAQEINSANFHQYNRNNYKVTIQIQHIDGDINPFFSRHIKPSLPRFLEELLHELYQTTLLKMALLLKPPWSRKKGSR
jgi:hypothetical protein